MLPPHAFVSLFISRYTPGTLGSWCLQPHLLAVLLLSQLSHIGYHQPTRGCWGEHPGKSASSSEEKGGREKGGVQVQVVEKQMAAISRRLGLF